MNMKQKCKQILKKLSSICFNTLYFQETKGVAFSLGQDPDPEMKFPQRVCEDYVVNIT